MNRAASFVLEISFETGSMTKILDYLQWEILKQRRKVSRLILFYKGLKGQASIPVDDLKAPLERTRNQYSQFFQLPYASSDPNKHSFSTSKANFNGHQPSR